jgi:hypothetical protein
MPIKSVSEILPLMILVPVLIASALVLLFPEQVQPDSLNRLILLVLASWGLLIIHLIVTLSRERKLRQLKRALLVEQFLKRMNATAPARDRLEDTITNG